MGAVRKHSESASLVPGVEIFATGVHRDKPYDIEDLDSIIRNFQEFSAPSAPQILLRVPAIVGHEEDQHYLERTDIPAAGWMTRMWRKGGRLFADLDHVPPQVARLLKGKVYRTVSLEVYDDPPDGIPGEGKMARRLALLGGDIPEVKGLNEIPAPVPYSESAVPPRTALHFLKRVRLPGGVWACFSEVRRMAEKTPDEFQPGDRVRHSYYMQDKGKMGRRVPLPKILTIHEDQSGVPRTHVRVVDDDGLVSESLRSRLQAGEGDYLSHEQYAEQEEPDEFQPGDRLLFSYGTQSKGKGGILGGSGRQPVGYHVIVHEDQKNVRPGDIRVTDPRNGMVQRLARRNLQAATSDHAEADYGAEDDYGYPPGTQTPVQEKGKPPVQNAERWPKPGDRVHGDEDATDDLTGVVDHDQIDPQHRQQVIPNGDRRRGQYRQNEHLKDDAGQGYGGTDDEFAEDDPEIDIEPEDPGPLKTGDPVRVRTNQATGKGDWGGTVGHAGVSSETPPRVHVVQHGTGREYAIPHHAVFRANAEEDEDDPEIEIDEGPEPPERPRRRIQSGERAITDDGKQVGRVYSINPIEADDRGYVSERGTGRHHGRNLRAESDHAPGYAEGDGYIDPIEPDFDKEERKRREKERRDAEGKWTSRKPTRRDMAEGDLPGDDEVYPTRRVTVGDKGKSTQSGGNAWDDGTVRDVSANNQQVDVDLDRGGATRRVRRQNVKPSHRPTYRDMAEPDEEEGEDESGALEWKPGDRSEVGGNQWTGKNSREVTVTDPVSPHGVVRVRTDTGMNAGQPDALETRHLRRQPPTENMAEPDNELDAREADMAATYWDREKKRRASLSRFAEEGATDGTGDRNIDDDAPQGDEEKMRREMIDRLCDMGMDEEAIPDGVSVAFLADIVRMLESKQAEAEQAGEEQGEQQGEAQGKQEQATQDEQGGQPQPVAGEQPGQPEGGEELPWAQEMPEEEQPRREFAEAYKREDDADRNQQNTTAPNDTRRRIELQLKQGDDREANREFNRKQDRESPRRPRQMDMAEPEREYDDLDDDASDEDRRRREEERRKRDDDDMSDDRDDDMIDGEEMAERSMAEEAPGYRGERQPSLTDSNPRRGQRADRTDANGRQYGPSGDMSDEAYEDWQAGERNEYAEGDDLPEIEEEEGIDLGPPIRDVQNPKEREARGREGQRQIQQNNRRADRMTRRFHAGQENGSQAGDINDLHFSEDDDQQANDDAQQEWEQRQPPERRRPYEPDQTDANGRSPGGYRRMPGWQQRPQPEDFDDFAEEAEEAARQNQDTSRESDRALDEFLDASDGPVSTRMAEEEPEPEEWDRDPNECPHGVYRGASDCPICDRPSRVGQNRGESNKQPSRPDEEFAEDDDNEEGGPRRPSNTRRPFDVEPDPTENLPPPMPPSSRRKGGNRGHSVDPPRRHAEGMEETGDEPDEFESGDPVRRTLHWTQQHKGKSSGNAYVSPSQHQGLFTVHEDQTHVPEGHIRIRGQQGERHVVPTQDLEHDHPDNFAEGVEQFADEENGVDNTGARAAEVASRRRARGADRKVVRANQQRGQNQPARPQQPNQGSAPMKLSELAVLIRREVQSAIQGETRKAGQSLHAESTKAINEVRKHSEQIARTEKKRGVDAIIDRLSREGKLPPVLVPSVRQRLMRADTRTHVAKFSEQGKRDVLLTEFDCQVRELERMPTLFSERFSQGDGKGGNKQEAEDAQIAKIEDHFEAFSESFRSVPGSSKEKLVEGYKAARKSRPGITADEFLNL